VLFLPINSVHVRQMLATVQDQTSVKTRKKNWQWENNVIGEKCSYTLIIGKEMINPHGEG